MEIKKEITFEYEGETVKAIVVGPEEELNNPESLTTLTEMARQSYAAMKNGEPLMDGAKRISEEEAMPHFLEASLNEALSSLDELRILIEERDIILKSDQFSPEERKALLEDLLEKAKAMQARLK